MLAPTKEDDVTRTYEIKETRRSKIVGGINGSRRRWATSYDVIETTGGREKLVATSFCEDFSRGRLSYLREHLA